jgi:thioredoxin 1
VSSRSRRKRLLSQLHATAVPSCPGVFLAVWRTSLNPANIHSAEDFKTKVTEATTPVVVDWFATWCGPCKAISPAIEKFSNEDAHSKVAFYKIDVDELAEVAASNGISAMPTFDFYQGGKKVETVKGANPPGIQAALKKISE